MFHLICLEQLLHCFRSIDAASRDMSTQWEVSAKELERRDCRVPKHENKSHMESSQE